MIKLPGYFTRFGSKADGSCSLSFNTQEITPEDFAELKRNLNNFGYILFKEGVIQDSDIPKEPLTDEDAKTPSQRLRAILFVVWKEKGIKEDFDTYYRNQMEKIIDIYKEKLS